jgi:predicted GNAT family N-acyltransferase
MHLNLAPMIIKKPADCTKEELNEFIRLVSSGGQVATNGLEERIRNCKALGFYYVNNELAGVSAIKQKGKEIVKRTLKKAKVETDNIPTLELGYSYTKPKFRGQGINKKINDGLLELIDQDKIYATTDNDTMRNYLKNKGFKKVGESFLGQFNETLDYFEK